MQHFVLTWELLSAMNNKLLGALIAVFALSLHWTCQWLHSIALGDEALGVLTGLMILLALMWDRDKKGARASVVRCMRLLLWAVVLIVMGWMEPLMMAIVPGELGRMLPGILVGLGSAVLVLSEEISFKRAPAKAGAASGS
jgi:hypothetical protein